MYVLTQVQFDHDIIVTNPRIVPGFIIHRGHGGEPRVEEQYVPLLCDTSTHVFFCPLWVEMSQHSAEENGTVTQWYIS